MVTPMPAMHVEGGVNGDSSHISQQRLVVGAGFDDLVVRAGLHAMRRSQHQFRRDQRTGAEIAARADNGDDGAADARGRRHPAADDGVSGRCGEQRQDCEQVGRDFHRGSSRT